MYYQDQFTPFSPYYQGNSSAITGNMLARSTNSFYTMGDLTNATPPPQVKRRNDAVAYAREVRARNELMQVQRLTKQSTSRLAGECQNGSANHG